LKSKARSLTVLAVIVLLFVLPMALSAAAPSVRVDPPSPDNAVVDGSENEWQVTPTAATNPDWFSVTCTGNGGGGTSCSGNEYGDLFLRYNCTSNSLFVLMYADRGKDYTSNPSANWIKIAGGHGNSPVIQEGDAGWANLTNGMGYEAMVAKDGAGNAFVPGNSYSINFHSQMGGTTSGTGETTVTLPKCDVSTAVSLHTFTASASGGHYFPALPVLGVGMVVLGAVVAVRRPRR
jgi:hypothetical protein